MQTGSGDRRVRCRLDAALVRELELVGKAQRRRRHCSSGFEFEGRPRRSGVLPAVETESVASVSSCLCNRCHK
jgi:hypothetical protein